MKKASHLRKATGVVLTALLLLSWFSPLQQALRSLPDSLTLTRGQASLLRLGGLSASGEALTVTSSADETLAAAGAVDVIAQSAGTTELLLSLFGVPVKRVEVTVSEEKRLIPGGQALGDPGRK